MTALAQLIQAVSNLTQFLTAARGPRTFFFKLPAVQGVQVELITPCTPQKECAGPILLWRHVCCYCELVQNVEAKSKKAMSAAWGAASLSVFVQTECRAFYGTCLLHSPKTFETVFREQQCEIP